MKFMVDAVNLNSVKLQPKNWDIVKCGCSIVANWQLMKDAQDGQGAVIVNLMSMIDVESSS